MSRSLVPKYNTRESKLFLRLKSRNTLMIKFSTSSYNNKSRDCIRRRCPLCIICNLHRRTIGKGKRRRTEISCLLCHELKGFCVIGVEKKETTSYGPITSGGRHYRVSCVLCRSKTGMTLRNKPAKTKGPIDTNCAG